MTRLPPFLLLAALAALACPAHAEGTFGLGIADSHDGESAGVADLSLRWPMQRPNLLADQHEILAGFIESRPLPLLDRNVFYLGYGVRKHWGQRWYTGFGVVAVDGVNEALSSWYQFATTGGVRLGRVNLTLRHLSNSGFRGRNRGETILTLGWNW